MTLTSFSKFPQLLYRCGIGYRVRYPGLRLTYYCLTYRGVQHLIFTTFLNAGIAIVEVASYGADSDVIIQVGDVKLWTH